MLLFPLARVTLGCSAKEIIDLTNTKNDEREDRYAPYRHIQSSITKPSAITADEHYERLERWRHSRVPQKPGKGRRQLRGRAHTTHQSHWRPHPQDPDQPGNVSQGWPPLPGLRVEGRSGHPS